MAYEHVYFKGKTKWFRHMEPDTMWDPPRWKHVFYPDKDSLEKFKALQEQGIRNLLKKDDDGYFFNLSRPSNIKAKGKVIGLTAPKVMDADGKPFTGSVGNGSDITTKCEVRRFTTPGGKKGIALRWDSSRIDNLVPYERERDFFDEEKEQVKGLMEQSQPEW